MALEKLASLLKKRSFISIATADKQGEPHAVPKFLLKVQDGCVFLIDYAIAKTVDNIRINPRACLSLMDLDNLEGYRISGSTSLIEQGAEYDAILKEYDKKLIQMSATRFIEGMRSGKKTEHFELEIPNKVIVIKVHVEEIVRVSRQGELFRDKP